MYTTKKRVSENHQTIDTTEHDDTCVKHTPEPSMGEQNLSNRAYRELVYYLSLHDSDLK